VLAYRGSACAEAGERVPPGALKELTPQSQPFAPKFKNSKSKVIMIVLPNATPPPLLTVALLLTLSWLSDPLSQVRLPGKHALRSACRKLTRRCSWDQYPRKTIDGGRTGKREELDCGAGSGEASGDTPWSSAFRAG